MLKEDPVDEQEEGNSARDVEVEVDEVDEVDKVEDEVEEGEGEVRIPMEQTTRYQSGQTGPLPAAPCSVSRQIWDRRHHLQRGVWN